MNRPQRRALAMAGLVLDVLGLLVLGCVILAGVIRAGTAAGPAVILAASLAGEVAYLYLTRRSS